MIPSLSYFLTHVLYTHCASLSLNLSLPLPASNIALANYKQPEGAGGIHQHARGERNQQAILSCASIRDRPSRYKVHVWRRPAGMGARRVTGIREKKSRAAR